MSYTEDSAAAAGSSAAGAPVQSPGMDGLPGFTALCHSVFSTTTGKVVAIIVIIIAAIWLLKFVGEELSV